MKRLSADFEAGLLEADEIPAGRAAELFLMAQQIEWDWESDE